MLIVSRKIGEKVYIGDVCVTVVDIYRGKVRLGIKAPREIPVDREEIRERKLHEVSQTPNPQD